MRPTTTDQTTWARVVLGDGVAFQEIFNLHGNRVLRHAQRFVQARADAEDVVAMVFLEAWRKRERVRFVDDSMLPWLLVTATNLGNNVARGQRRYRALLNRFPVDTSFRDPTDDFDDGEAVIALRSLSTADQRIITLCVLEGFSEKEAAQALGVPPGTVKSRLHRAKERLQRSYKSASTVEGATT
jgi:RNA polymerase sigma-70 factor (ECF subfamily)